MKKIKFIFLNAFIIVFISTMSASAVGLKNPFTSQAPAKTVPAATAAKVPVQGPTQPAPAATTAVQGKMPPAPASAPTATDTYTYSPLGKPDPFRPFIVVETAAKKKVEKKAPPSIFPLQRAETEMYKVVGIAGDENNRVAIAEDSAKKFYPLLKGTRIGLQNGKVVEIMADRVIVEEYEGKKTKRVILKLRKN